MTGLYKIYEIISNESYTKEDIIFILIYKFNVKNSDELRLLCKVIKWLERNFNFEIKNDKIIIGDTELECIYYDEGNDIFQFAKIIN